MGWELLPGGLSEDRLVVSLDDAGRARVQAELDRLVGRFGGAAWLIERDGTVLARAGGAPSALTLEMRWQAAHHHAESDVLFQPPRPREVPLESSWFEKGLERLPRTATLALRPGHVLIAAPDGDLPPSAVKDATARLESALLDAAWIVPPPEPIRLPDDLPPFTLA
jgi:hypothetical protein